MGGDIPYVLWLRVQIQTSSKKSCARFARNCRNKRKVYSSYLISQWPACNGSVHSPSNRISPFGGMDWFYHNVYVLCNKLTRTSVLTAVVSAGLPLCGFYSLTHSWGNNSLIHSNDGHTLTCPLKIRFWNIIKIFFWEFSARMGKITISVFISIC